MTVADAPMTAAGAIAGGASIGCLSLALRRSGWPSLARIRDGSLLACAALLALSFILPVAGWALALDALGLIAGVQSRALAFTRHRQLRDYAAMKPRDVTDEPPWWQEFEAAVQDHVKGRTRP